MTMREKVERSQVHVFQVSRSQMREQIQIRHLNCLNEIWNGSNPILTLFFTKISIFRGCYRFQACVSHFKMCLWFLNSNLTSLNRLYKHKLTQHAKLLKNKFCDLNQFSDK